MTIEISLPQSDIRVALAAINSVVQPSPTPGLPPGFVGAARFSWRYLDGTLYVDLDASAANQASAVQTAIEEALSAPDPGSN